MAAQRSAPRIETIYDPDQILVASPLRRFSGALLDGLFASLPMGIALIVMLAAATAARGGFCGAPAGMIDMPMGRPCLLVGMTSNHLLAGGAVFVLLTGGWFAWFVVAARGGQTPGSVFSACTSCVITGRVPGFGGSSSGNSLSRCSCSG